MTAVEAERAAILDGLRIAGCEPAGTTPAGLTVDPAEVTVFAAGVGVAAAAAGTARLLARAEAAGEPYDAVLCAGIAGGFADRIGTGGLVIATSVIAADLGADGPDGFIPIDALGFGHAAAAADPALVASIGAALPGATLGVVLTVSTVTGTAAGAAALRERYPDAVAEAMEGFGVATAAGAVGVPFGELRAISNPVGPRDRSAWQIPTALTALGTALASVSRALQRTP